MLNCSCTNLLIHFFYFNRNEHNFLFIYRLTTVSGDLDDMSLADPTLSEVISAPSTSSATSATTGKKRRKRSYAQLSEDDRALTVLTGFIKQSAEIQQEVLSQNQDGSKGPDDLLFASYAARLGKLPAQIQTYVKLQLSQLFFNAENRDAPPIPITPLPPQFLPQMTQQQQQSPNVGPVPAAIMPRQNLTTSVHGRQSPDVSEIISTAYNIANFFSIVQTVISSPSRQSLK